MSFFFVSLLQELITLRARNFTVDHSERHLLAVNLRTPSSRTLQATASNGKLISDWSEKRPRPYLKL